MLMFVPVEGALAAALTRDADLFFYAWERQVVPVGPPTLLMTMRTVASVWRSELQGALRSARLSLSLSHRAPASFAISCPLAPCSSERHTDATVCIVISRVGGPTGTTCPSHA